MAYNKRNAFFMLDSCMGDNNYLCKINNYSAFSLYRVNKRNLVRVST